MGLSEPRKRVKYSIDPNALRWTNDESKFGKRLMEKMGWQSGTGLGAKSNGMTENIKVKFKLDTKGVGYNNNDYDNVWLDHQDDFESVLSELNKSNKTDEEKAPLAEDKPINSLAQKSKERAKRLHYSKFSKSKDLSTASQHDLACILGTDKRSKKNKTSSADEDENEDVKDTNQRSDMCFSNNSYLDGPKQKKSTNVSEKEDINLFKTNPLSIGDYFAQKMKNKLSNNSVTMKTDDEDSNDYSPKASFQLTQEDGTKDEEEIVPKKKKKSKHKEVISEETSKTEENHKEVDEITEIKPKKKKKNKSKEKDNETTVEHQEAEPEPVAVKEETKNDQKINSFPGSNLFHLYGYSPYNISCSLDAILADKAKKANKKRVLVEKNLEKDSKFYAMNKKPTSAYKKNN